MLRPQLNATLKQHGLLPTLAGGTTSFLRADGTWSAPGGTPAGSDTQVQINISGAFGASANFTYDASDNFVAGDSAKAQLNVSGDNRRIHLNANSPVLGNTTGLFYIYNTNTSTYWYCTLDGAGAWVNTDTGSGSLPT